MGNRFSFNCKTMDARKNIDLPSHLFVEATGDSEVGFDPSMEISERVHDEDDAESCSHDVSDHYSRRTDLDGSEIEGYGEAIGDNEDEDEDEQGEEVNGCQIEKGGCLEKPCVSVESTKEPKSEKEKSRLFWEACLAS